MAGAAPISFCRRKAALSLEAPHVLGVLITKGAAPELHGLKGHNTGN